MKIADKAVLITGANRGIGQRGRDDFGSKIRKSGSAYGALATTQ